MGSLPKSFLYFYQLFCIRSLSKEDSVVLEALFYRLVSHVVEDGLEGQQIGSFLAQVVMPGSMIHQLNCKTSQSAMPVSLPCSVTW